MRNRLLTVLALAAALVVPASLPPTAAATFHEVSIREVFPGDTAQPDAEYVELQAYASGQEFIAGHSVTFRSAAGSVIGTEPFAKDVADGRNQMTFVMATPAAEARFGIAADEEIGANLLDPTGGAVCWEGLDCVSWGAFSGPLPSPAGSPATAIPDGMALRRTIAPGCPTLLEESDDRDNSAADFSAVFPAPRPNSVAPGERACGSAGGGGSGGSAKKGAPETILRKKPARRTRDRTPTFRFSSNEAYATFQCKLDRKRYRACGSTFTAKRLSIGAHVFRVRARYGPTGTDPSPATYRFTVLARRR